MFFKIWYRANFSRNSCSESNKIFLIEFTREYSIKRSITNLIKVETYNQAKGRDSRPMTYLIVNQTDFLNVLVPLFDSLIKDDFLKFSFYNIYIYAFYIKCERFTKYTILKFVKK